MLKPKILAVVRDVGGANAVLPVLQQLQQANLVDLTLIGDKFALKVLAQQSLPYKTKEDYGHCQDLATLAKTILAIEQPDLVLTGTSMGNNIEHETLYLAKTKNITTISVLDHW
jgi:competence protein ComGF